MSKIIISTLIAISILSAQCVQAFEYGSHNEILSLINYERSLNNQRSLEFNPLLVKAAQDKAEAIFQYQYFSHNVNNLPFEYFIDATGYNYKNVGENLAVDFTSPEETVNAWMNSPSHKKNILYANFDETGIAIVNGKLNNVETTVIVQAFGESKDVLSQNSKDIRYFQVKAFWVGGGLVTSGTIMGLGITLIERKRKRGSNLPV